MGSRSIPRITFPVAGGSGPPPAPTVDHIAPTILVGNTIEGDSAVPYTNGEFRYIPDTGNGAGIAAGAAILSTGDGGRLYIRRGTYDFNLPGGPTGPIGLTGEVSVAGEGKRATTIVGRNVGNQGVFQLGGLHELCDMSIECRVADAAGVGSVGVVQGLGAGVYRNLEILVTASATGALRAGLAITAGAAANPTVIDAVAVACNTKTGPVTPTIGFRFSGGAYAQMTNITTVGGDIGVSADRSFVKITNFDATGYAVSGLQQTNSTGGGGGGQVQMNNFRFVSDGNVASIGLNVGWTTSQFSNGYIAGAGAHGILVNRPGSRPIVGIENIYMTGPTIGVEFRTTNYAQISNLTVFVPAGGTGIRLDNALFSLVDKTSIFMSTGVGVDVTNFSGGSTFKQPQFNIADAGASTAIGMRFQPGISGCAVQGGLFQCESVGVPVLMTSCLNMDIIGNNIVVVQANTTALPLVQVIDSVSVIVSNNRLSATGRNHPKISLEATVAQGTNGCVVNGNIVSSANAQPGIRLDANTTQNQVVGNFCRGSMFGGNPAVQDLGTVNNLASNYGS